MDPVERFPLSQEDLLRRRNRLIRILISKSGVTEPRELGELSETVSIKVGFLARSRQVRITPKTGIHLSTRRGGKEEVRWCVEKAGSVIQEPTHFGIKQQPENRFAVGRETDRGRYLVVIIKRVSMAELPEEELWVQTIIPMGKTTWDRWIKVGQLLPVAP